MNRIFAGHDPDFLFWTPSADDVVRVGPEERIVPLPAVPIPLHPQALEDNGSPGQDAIGAGVYDYLRRYPDCENAYQLADLLRDAFPHYLADIASQILMIEEKDVDPAYIHRQIAGMKLLARLEPNPQLYYLLGRNYVELGLTLSELMEAPQRFLAAAEYLRRSLQLQPQQPAALNLLAQVSHWLGDDTEALRLWEKTVTLLDPGPARTALSERIALLPETAPRTPLAEDLALFGSTLVMIGNSDCAGALAILERLDEEGRVPEILAAPEFYYLLGVCRERLADPAGALVAWEKALQLDPAYQPALDDFARVSGE